jgi:D-glycero-alpha-D-manno-heptose-7-phosphate kinase
VVAMVAALAKKLNVSMTQYELARMAWRIERVDLGFAGGWQDQYAATFGGFNYMESREDGRIIVNPLRIRRGVLSELEASLLLYFGGVSRDSAEVISEQQDLIRSRSKDAVAATHSIRAEAEAMKDCLLVGDITGFARSLESGWQYKKRLASRITNPDIERAHEVARANGMVAGKVSGAGGGGFMMLLVDPARRFQVRRALEEECGGHVSTCHFTKQGAETWTVPTRGNL